MIRSVVVAIVCIGVIACITSCATSPLAPGTPRVVERLAIAPYAAHEECVDLGIGDRLDYRFESNAPVDFDIRYSEANAVVAPIVRAHSTADSDIFEAQVAAHYCLDWQTGADGAVIGYRLLVRPGA